MAFANCQPNDPRRVDRNEAPLVLDSPEPRLDITKYMEQEARFKMVELRSPERYAELVEAARDGVQQRRALYEQMARIHLPTEHHPTHDRTNEPAILPEPTHA